MEESEMGKTILSDEEMDRLPLGRTGFWAMRKDGILYVNNQAREENAGIDHISDPGLAENEIILKKEPFFFAAVVVP